MKWWTYLDKAFAIRWAVARNLNGFTITSVHGTITITSAYEF